MEKNNSCVSDKELQLVLVTCRKYLDGAWKNIPDNLIQVDTVSGGLTNLLYHCALDNSVILTNDEPRQVLLRIYGPLACNTDVQVEIFERLAQASLGPRLYSAFDKGRFEEYLPSSPLTWTQMTDDSISQVIAKKFAAIHKLDVPQLDKNSSWLLDNCNEFNNFVESARKNPLCFDDNILESTKQIAREMMNIDFKKEIQHLSKLLKDLNLPLVFSHNDLHQNNVILLHDTNQSLDDRIVLIDFEYCAYNYLTFDLANHLSEWCFDYNNADYPYFYFSLDKFPSDTKQKRFLSYYIDEMDEKCINDTFAPLNLNRSDFIHALYNAMNPVFMGSNLLWCIWAIKSVLTSKIRFGYWEMAKCKWEVYLLCKRRASELHKNYDAKTNSNALNNSSKL